MCGSQTILVALGLVSLAVLEMTRKSKKTNVEGTDITDTHSPDRVGSVSSVHYDGLPSGGKKNKRAPTVSDIIVDPITQLAGEHWASTSEVLIILLIIHILRGINLIVCFFPTEIIPSSNGC